MGYNYIMHGMPAGQLSFILHGGSDTLTTPLNLESESGPAVCQLCGSSFPTTLHILNGYPTALNQGRLQGNMTVSF